MRLNVRKSFLKGLIAIVLCISLLAGVMLASAKTQQKAYTTLYNEDKVSSEFFAENVEYKKDYPNGAVLFTVVNAKLKMDNFYVIEIYRMGGTNDKASVPLETVDYTAGYGIDYEIYLSNDYGESPVKGEAASLYAMEEFSFIPSMKSKLKSIDEHLRTMIRVIIWKQWKVASKR